MMETGHELQILAGSEAVVERRRFRNVADALLHFERLFDDVEAGNQGAARAGLNETGEDLDRRGLTRAVRSEEPENLTRLDTQVEINDCLLLVVALEEMFGDDHPVPAIVSSSNNAA